jgi:hypothetical protein
MINEIRALDVVETDDAARVGLAQALFYRARLVNPALRLYGVYLQVKNFATGSDYYIPTDFIAGRDPASGIIRLTVPFRVVMDETWFRMPQFVLQGEARREALPVAEPVAA